PEDQQAVAELMRRHGLVPHEFVVVHPGARLPTKCWPPERFARVLDEVEESAGLKTVLIGGGEERPLAESIRETAQAQPVDLAGQLPFGQLVALLQNCRLYIGNDTGPMHVAAAVGAPVIALFGLPEPARWGPVGENHVVLRASMPCPCPFPKVCQPPYPDKTLCVRRIAVDEVIEAVRHQLSTVTHSLIRAVVHHES
ncbi:MAG: glycosyltransferase family 9 protein, partial [Armatimonadota bacterium]|nr:glycosyltransferase family 9 protein [Armatimonadota bacterium]